MMRTLLLFVFALGIIGSSMAQKAALKAMPHPKSIHPYTVNVLEQESSNSTVFAPPVMKERPKGSNPLFSIDTTWLGSARNAYTLLIADQTCVWYDKTLNAVMATFRGNNKGTVMPLATGNDLITSFSADEGVTFTRKIALEDGSYHRYPSGVIHNPAGNTDINNCYSVVAGPKTDGAAWVEVYRSSVKYDGTNLDADYTPTSDGTEIPRQGLTATEDGYVHFCGDHYASDYTTSTLFIYNGSYNASNTMDWTQVDISLDDAIARKTDNSLISFFGDAHMAWNNDGSVGYVYVRGSDNRPAEKTSWVPILYKSTDKGATWNQVDYFDFSSLTEITDWILPVGTDDNVYRPMFDESDITVDAWGKPHIFATIRGAASSNIDSLTYIWTRTYAGNTHAADNNYFEVWQGIDDQWHAQHIDTVWTDEVTATESWFTSSTGNVGWDHRVQASRSYDGTKVFGTWTDSDYAFWGTEKYNLNPDLFLFGHSLVNSIPFSGPFNVTYLSDLWGISFFNFTSPVAIETAPNAFEIPVTVANITSNGNSADEPIFPIYAKGVSIDFPVGIGDKQQSLAKVSACYPNPSNGTTYFDVTVAKSNNVNVTITNITGQKVASKDYGTVLKGTRKLAIDNSNLTSGVYFCTITVGDDTFTNKMIVN
jgi:hypothetical protein